MLEAAAAGVPLLIAINVGGIPEIFGPQSDRLVPPGDPRALAQATRVALDDPDAAQGAARRLQARVGEHFSADAMTEQVLAGYREALDRAKRTPKAHAGRA